MNKIKYYLCIIIGLALSLSACIKEDLSLCGVEPPVEPVDEPMDVQVVFSYNEGETRIIPANELHKAVLYVFNSDNRLVNFWDMSNPKLNEASSIQLLPQTYSFVVWFNPIDPYAITPVPAKGTTLKSDGRLSLQVPSSGKINGSAVESLPLLYGQKEETIQKDRENVVTVPVYENTNRINITVKGLTPTTHTYLFSIEDNNGAYTFNNDFSSCLPFSYVAETHYSGTDLQASLTVLRLAANRSPILKIQDVDTGEIIYPVSEDTPDNLIELLQIIYPGNDFNKKHVYDIVITFDNMGMDLWINDWQVVSSDTELTS